MVPWWTLLFFIPDCGPKRPFWDTVLLFGTAILVILVLFRDPLFELFRPMVGR